MPIPRERGVRLQTPEVSPLEKLNRRFAGKDILSIDQFDPASISDLFHLTTQMAEVARNAKPNDLLKGNIVTLLFYEPSTRTRGSFDAATKRLGGQTIVVENPQQSSSVSRREILEDAISRVRVFEAYSDVIILRHPEVGSAQKAVDVAKFVPVINAGDGIGEHPTQTLLDLYTIHEKMGTLSGLKGLFAGDMKNGRTVHSLIKGLSLYPNNTIYLLSPRKLKLQTDLLKKLKGKGLKIIEIENPEEIPRDCNFWYWTRTQKERFADPSEYEELKHSFVVDKQLLRDYGNKDMILMHPLPRVGEISINVDDDPRAVYLRNQIGNGVYVRMAIISLVLGKIK